MNLPVVHLNDRGTRMVLQQLPSLGSDCIADISTNIQPGETVRVFTDDNTFAGIGYLNTLSAIPLRILSFQERYLDDQFWLETIKNALDFRLRRYPTDESFRLVYGDVDELPGLIIDKFGSCLSVQITTAGIERHTDTIVNTLITIFQPTGIILACDSLPRKKEGLSLFRRVAYGTIPKPFYAQIDGIEHAIDFFEGHKTGFFLDQRDNRARAVELCAKKKVLDVFCFSGAFGIRACLHDAEYTTCIDVFEPGLEMGKLTADRYDINKRIEFVQAEAFSFLNQNHDKWDIVFLDPPSFVRGKHRSRRNLSNYQKIASLAIQNLAPQGILITSCCSFHVTPEDFKAVTFNAFHRQGRKARIFHVGSQSFDHPIHPGIRGTDYLKCFFVAAD